MNKSQNIIDTYYRSTPDERQAGLSWYLDAHVIARNVGKGNLKLGAALIAVTSPMQKWERNVIVAKHAMEFGSPYPGMKAIMDKVSRLLEGENPDTVVSGQKVTSFYRNILDPYGPEVTIDRHAIDIALAKRHTDTNRPSIGKKMYAELADAYRDAAVILGISPLELQAVTWVTWRRELGIK
jgi:hypothetical protein